MMPDAARVAFRLYESEHDYHSRSRGQLVLLRHLAPLANMRSMPYHVKTVSVT